MGYWGCAAKWGCISFHDSTDYNGVASSSIFNRVTRIGSQDAGVYKFAPNRPEMDNNGVGALRLMPVAHIKQKLTQEVPPTPPLG